MTASLAELVDDFSVKRAARLADAMSVTELQRSVNSLVGQRLNPSASSMRAELMKSWARRDANAAWAYALSLPKTTERARLLGAVAGVLVATNAQRAIELANALPTSSEQKSVVKTILDEWAKVNPEAAIRYLKTHPDLPVDAFAGLTLISSIAQRDPPLAAKLALSMTAAEYSDGGLGNAVLKWIELDANATRQWALSLTDPLQRDKALGAYSAAIASNDPRAAMEMISEIAAGDVRLGAERKVITEWLNIDPQGAAEYLRDLDEVTVSKYDFFLGLKLNDLTFSQQQKFIAGLGDGSLKEGIVRGMVRSATSNGQFTRAVNAINLMQEGDQRDRSVYDLAVGWSKSDPKALTDWLMLQPDSSDRDMILAGHAASQAARNPSASLSLAGSIPDKKIQKAAYENVVARWMAVDPGAATAWLNQSNLFSDREREGIVRRSKYGTAIDSKPRVSTRR
ncbi:MAG: hypothetical protein JNJ83_15215 [Verrucomicrobiaceae bacterium]|nr:hypothetical protein [Verrucomicrobiaceae bacterium]